MTETSGDPVDLFVVGGGVNGAAIARDAAGRGLSVALAEMGDLAQETSSASTKLFHGGLRYLEFFEFRLVRESLRERETLLRAMPHISWPMRFVLPYDPAMRFASDTPTARLLARLMPWTRGRRPAWVIRLGLFLYDHLGGRGMLPGTRTLDLAAAPEGRPLKPHLRRAFEYSDGWVDDSRLVVLIARDAEARGARIRTRTKLVAAARGPEAWTLTLQDMETGARDTVRARALVNAAGPWVEDLLTGTLGLDSAERIRLVRGSHIVTRRLFDHDKCYFFQGSDGRIVFAIPYEQDFTLIGTTDQPHAGDPAEARASREECDYLRRFVSDYLQREIAPDDIVWTYSGVRPLHDTGAASATAATRDYLLALDDRGAPVLSVFGGKITTHRRLAEQAVDRLAGPLGSRAGPWTAGAPLPGGDFRPEEKPGLARALCAAHPFLSGAQAARLVRAYGTEAATLMQGAREAGDLGRDFGAGLSEREVAWLMEREYARTAEDVAWRRSKLGLRMTADEIAALDDWMAARRAGPRRAAAE